VRRPSGYALFFRAGSANNARNVNTDGTLNRNNAYNGNNGLRPASMDPRLINRPETDGEHCAPSSKEGISLPQPRPSDRPGHG